MKRNWFSIGTTIFLTVALTACNAPIATQPSKQQADYISMETAQAAALNAAQVIAESADISATELHEVAGVTCYKVLFTVGDYAYSYTINAVTGEVMEATEREQGAITPGETPAAQSPTQVDEAKAQEIALAHAGVAAADATITKTKLDYEDNRQVYDIEWYTNGAKYDYEIAVDTGEILGSDYESKTMVGAQNNATVSESAAKQTALDRVPGATTADITKWELDYDDGRPEYEGEIIYDGMEYDFTIDATGGAVLEWDTETLYR